MKPSDKQILNALLYFVVFIVIQILVSGIVIAVDNYFGANNQAASTSEALSYISDTALALSSVISSALTIALFLWRKWSPLSRSYLRSNPWSSLIWVVLLSIGAILPLQWIYEQLNISMPEQMEALFKSIMGNRWGYLALGILAPIAEEMVFRGAVLRTLLRGFNSRLHWIPIVVSALLFGIVHGNLAQASNAFIIGLLLGWMYYRTDSIVPGIVLHWVNNTVAYVMFQVMPDMADGKLIDLFHGDRRLMYMGLACSLLVLIPSLFQLCIRLKKDSTAR